VSLPRSNAAGKPSDMTEDAEFGGTMGMLEDPGKLIVKP
jgi:hypothetical protein